MTAPSETRAAQRRDPGWWSPHRLPVALRAYEDAAGGERGSVGLLDMEFAVVAGVTRAVRQFHRTPLYVLQPIHLDEHRPGMAFIYLQHQGDGLLQGDRYRLDLEVAQGAEVHVTTQAATKIYRMDAGFAAQQVHLTAAAGSFLEYLPEPVMPYAGSRYLGETTVTVHPEATVLYAETLLPGRLARGEWHAYDVFDARTRVRRPEGEQLALDALSFAGPNRRPGTPARLGGYGVIATFFALAPAGRADGLQAALLPLLQEAGDVVAGVSILPFGAGVVARVLGPSSIPVRRVIHRAWDAARRHLVGSPAPDLRRD